MSAATDRGPPRRRVVTTACAVVLLCASAVLPTYLQAFRHGVNLPEALYGPGLAFVAGAALFARWRFGLNVFLAFAAAAAGVPAAVMTKVAIDVIGDPTTHNLWPFEIAIATGVALPPAAAGAAIGWLLAKALPPGRA